MLSYLARVKSCPCWHPTDSVKALKAAAYSDNNYDNTIAVQFTDALYAKHNHMKLLKLMSFMLFDILLPKMTT